MQSRVAAQNTTSLRCRVFIRDSTTRMGKIGLAFNTAGFSMAYNNGPSDTAHAITLVTQTVGGTWASGGFVEVDNTKMPGWYQLDVPNAALLSTGAGPAQIVWKGTGILDDYLDIELTGFDPNTIDKAGFKLATDGLNTITGYVP